uniref:Uncharacterized protein n=1 Tax=Grammatophora oceanica TaxID=210454 RepID=A0A7S1YH68_9STRA|mmetsp:Transcript_46329/g.68978  ORF Transcript_46329/g.68978 Transcript_46329/m.68978 type:complete len:116 (+) Transcript_46329:122-469(+)|eukprot:CAMPEP_0194048512 /NCGR_PEP_ID=MMETSP0009_2-20130614/27539_1 /TAXON_ID=210454 /ORGANISM="Grammatophora oceanica, Strain CCMP 410" /LENGTH=115 /DNA_ID=CAMNT_0038694403 /DNA_START=122 /DNA_END=469 /DNA_ORIENTATION=-
MVLSEQGQRTLKLITWTVTPLTAAIAVLDTSYTRPDDPTAKHCFSDFHEFVYGSVDQFVWGIDTELLKEQQLQSERLRKRMEDAAVISSTASKRMEDAAIISATASSSNAKEGGN